ncbi:MAG: CitMHS family transporter [Sphingomonas sp.]|uniref:CitMHS family transporter n=1 Tax=Sphingomonas sp. TaxID=28214 RepID=UPI0026092FC2|nr:CitMHS family transporter [Sphingomonas sp.]MDK2766933.1 CitMHS family transporter [Sphingomonas sp.]
MLSLIAYAMVATFMTLIMTKRMAAMVALVIIPIVFALFASAVVGNFGLADLGPMMLDGVKELAPTGVMLIFAILYFGLMIDVGLFDPMVAAIVKIVHGDPVRILVGTAILALTVSLDGDGTTTYMITTAAMLPLYRHMKLDVRMLACIVVMSGAVMNVLPWGGPTARVMGTLRLDAADVFVPLIPAMAATAAWVIFVAYRFGCKERDRLALLPADAIDENASAQEIIAESDSDYLETRRPKLFVFNLVLTLGLLVSLISGAFPSAVLFIVFFAIALSVNFPNLEQQRQRVSDHAGNALSVAGLVFAAGIFTGILSGTKMVDAMSASVIAAIPEAWGPYMGPITGAISAPFTFFISNDAFYFGMLPILAEAGSHYGLTAAEIGRASLIGQQIHLLSPLVPSSYLLAGFVGVDFGEFQRFTLKWACGSFLVFFAATFLFGIVPFVS